MAIQASDMLLSGKAVVDPVGQTSAVDKSSAGGAATHILCSFDREYVLNRLVLFASETFATADADIDLGYRAKLATTNTGNTTAYAEELGFLNADTIYDANGNVTDEVTGVTDIVAGVVAVHNLGVVIPKWTQLIAINNTAAGAGQYYWFVEYYSRDGDPRNFGEA